MLIAFDMDGTLLFLKDLHQVEVVEELSETLVRAKFPSLQPSVLAFRLFSKGSASFMALSTHSALGKLAVCKDAKIIIASAARPGTVLKRFFALTSAHHLILENGGSIYNARNFEKDMQWDETLRSEYELLPLVADDLKSKGWKLDDEGRETALRIRFDENPNMTEEGFSDLVENYQLPSELVKTSNLGHLDIICASAGKDKALAYLSKKLGEEVAYAVGDDINDIAMLQIAKKAFVVNGQFPEVIIQANKHGWQVSSSEDVAGINQVIQSITKDIGG